MIRVLIVDDSPVAQELLRHILASDPEIQVAGVVNDGADALEMVRQKRPDIITMDIHMPTMDGFEATRRIMETQPTPIVVVSGSSGTKEVTFSFRAMEAGALAVVPRPPGVSHPEFEAAARDLIQTIKLMAEVRVVTRQARVGKEPFSWPPFAAPAAKAAAGIKIAAIGASTGGPPALQRILSGLPADLPVPVLIAQHIARGFVQGFVEWLGQASRFPVRIASPGEYPLPGCGYVAPDDFHLGVESGPRLVLGDQDLEHGARPSIAYLFRSVAKVFGPRAVGVLLTGMGSDGARELKEMKDQGAVTIAQDAASSVIHGLPGAAIRLDAATYILPPEGIAAFLASLPERSNRGPQ